MAKDILKKDDWWEKWETKIIREKARIKEYEEIIKKDLKQDNLFPDNLRIDKKEEENSWL